MADLGKYLNPEVVNAVERLDLQAKCIADAYLNGRHKSPRHGFSTQFSQHRAYIKGDPIKDIDWKVYARSDKYYIKKFEAETNIECTFAIDTSESMHYQSESASFSKLDYCICLCSALSLLLIKQQDSPGLITFNEDIDQFIPPSASGQKQLLKIIHALDSTQRGLTTNFEKALPQAASLLKHRGMVIIFSDLLGDTEQALQTLKNLSFAKHDVMLFHVLDPEELNLNNERFSEYSDPEKPDKKININPSAIKDHYQKLIQDFIAKVEDQCAQAKISSCLIDTSDSFEHAIQNFMLQRRSMLWFFFDFSWLQIF